MSSQLIRLLDHLNAEPHGYNIRIIRGKLSEAPDDLWELICTWPQRYIDDLAALLSKRNVISTNKLRALQILRPLVEEVIGAKITYVSPHEGAIQNDQPTKPEKESSMQTHATMKQKPVKATAATAKKVKGAAQKSVTKPKLAAKAARSVPESKVTVSSIIRAGITANKETDAILKDVYKKFPDSKATAKDVSWYRWKMNEA